MDKLIVLNDYYETAMNLMFKNRSVPMTALIMQRYWYCPWHLSEN